MGREAGAPEDDLLSIFHGTHFVLVDRAGQIRGYYDSADSDSTDRLLRDTKRLEREER
jgi:protein SCO1/2